MRQFNPRPKLFPMTVVVAVFAAAFVATVAISARTGGSATRLQEPSGPSIMNDSTSSSGFTVDIVRTTGFVTTLGFSVDLAEPLADGASPALDLGDLVVKTSGTEVVAHESWVKKVVYGVSPDRRKVSFALQGDPFLQSESLSVELAAFYVVPPGGNGIRQEGPWSAVVTVDPAKAPIPDDPLAEFSGRRIDTGFGWSYVIDSVRRDGIGVRVDYHVEGDVAGLTGIPPVVSDGEARAQLSTGKPGTLTAAPRSGSDVVRVRFGGGVRAIELEAAAQFAAPTSGSEATVSFGDRSAVATLETSTQADGDFISVRIESDLMLSGPGSPGQDARLTDDLGNVYPLYHGSASNPPKYSQWDFQGSIAPGATSLSFEVDGYGVVEQGDWTLDIPVR